MKKVLEAIQAALKTLAESKATGPRADSIRDHLKSCESNAAAEVKDAAKPKEGEGAFGLIQLLIGVALLGMIALCAVKAHADSFQITNIVNVSQSIISYPTNTPTTNGVRQSTGGAIDVRNNEWAGFYINGYATAASIINVTLIPSTGDSAAMFSQFDGTGTNGIALNWATNAQIVLSANVPAVGPFEWFTNLDRFFIGGASFVGCYTVTNAVASGGVTNLDCGLRKKIIPIRYP